jgi:hypothetical protein
MNHKTIGCLALGAFAASLSAAPVIGIGDNRADVMGLYSSFEKTVIGAKTSIDSVGVGVGAVYSIMDEAEWGIEAGGSLVYRKYSAEVDYSSQWGNLDSDYDYNMVGFAGGAVAYYKLRDDLKPFAGLNLIYRRVSGDYISSSSDTDVGYVAGIEWKISEQWSVTPSLVDNGIDSDVVVSTNYQVSDRWAITGVANLTNDEKSFGLGVTTAW